MKQTIDVRFQERSSSGICAMRPAPLAPAATANFRRSQRSYEHEDRHRRRPMKVRDILKQLARDGWVLAQQESSHRQFVHPTKPGKVTVAGHPSDEIAPGTLKSIQRQAGIK
jgi:predicted RNA binding protein YcfA (HicA-like mRNA interferase family)